VKETKVQAEGSQSENIPPQQGIDAAKVEASKTKLEKTVKSKFILWNPEKLKAFFAHYYLAFVSGLLIGTSYIPFPPWAVLFCFAPLWYFWLFKASSKREVFWSGFWAQFVFSLIGFHWIFHTAHEFGGMPVPVAAIVLLLFACLQHLIFPIFGLLVFYLKEKKIINRPLSQTLFLASIWCLIEIYYPSLFQWHMGYTMLWSKFPIFHLADVFGFQGLSWFILLVNAIFTFAFTLHPKKEQVFVYCFSALAVFLTLNFWGSYHSKYWKKLPEKTINFLPIQANIGNVEKVYAEKGLGFQDHITDTFVQISDEALQKYPESQIVVWPESAIPEFLDPAFYERPRPKKIITYFQSKNKILITGGYSREINKNTLNSKGRPTEQVYNALFVLGGSMSSIIPPFRKSQLLAFGEYTPFSDWFPKLKEISPAGPGFDKGPGPQVLNLPIQPQNEQLRLGPQICYESLPSSFAQQGTLAGAQVLINLTNDSWFGRYSEPHQHLYMTLARAVENRRPMIRVTNTGISTGIEASGKILPLSPVYEKWYAPVILHYSENPTLTVFTRYGHYLPFAVMIFILGVLIGDRIQRNQKPRLGRNSKPSGELRDSPADQKSDQPS
jgi:apolipoprotein N-acyltransferase